MQQKDNYLIQQILSGEKQLEQVLYKKYERIWFRLCLRYGKNRFEAEDILQEGLIYIFKDLKQFNSDKGKFRNWSNRVLVNAALRFLKKNQWQQSFTNLEYIEQTATIPENILTQITAKELTQIIQKLPLGYRIVFNMYAIEGYTHREIAEILNISLGTSKSQLFKARKALQKQIEVLF